MDIYLNFVSRLSRRSGTIFESKRDGCGFGFQPGEKIINDQALSPH